VEPLLHWANTASCGFFKEIEVILKKHKLNLTTPVHKFPEEVLQILFYGTDEEAAVVEKTPAREVTAFKFEGIINFLKRQQENGSEKILDWLKDFMVVKTCPECNGARLKKRGSLL